MQTSQVSNPDHSFGTGLYQDQILMHLLKLFLVLNHNELIRVLLIRQLLCLEMTFHDLVSRSIMSSCLSGSVLEARLSMNLPTWFHIPNRRLTSETFCGWKRCVINSTLVGSTSTAFLDTICPRNFAFPSENIHFSLKVIPASVVSPGLLSASHNVLFEFCHSLQHHQYCRLYLEYLIRDVTFLYGISLALRIFRMAPFCMPTCQMEL